MSIAKKKKKPFSPAASGLGSALRTSTAATGVSLIVAWAPEAGSICVVHGLSCPTAHGILIPRPEVKPTPPALEGGFLTTGPSVKSLKAFFLHT